MLDFSPDVEHRPLLVVEPVQKASELVANKAAKKLAADRSKKFEQAKAEVQKQKQHLDELKKGLNKGTDNGYEKVKQVGRNRVNNFNLHALTTTGTVDGLHTNVVSGRETTFVCSPSTVVECIDFDGNRVAVGFFSDSNGNPPKISIEHVVSMHPPPSDANSSTSR